MKIAVLGFGREGRSVYDYYKRLSPYGRCPEGTLLGLAMTDDEIWILDENPDAKVPEGTKTQLGANYLDNLNEFDLIYRSPGIPYNTIAKRFPARNACGKAMAGGQNLKSEILNLKLTSSTRLFFDQCPCPIIGVTGTKGKGTTCTLLYNILKACLPVGMACNREVYLVGNIGAPALDILPQLTLRQAQGKNPLVIFELSSFQLQDLHKSPAIAVVLDIFPDHQDAHASYEEYMGAKKNIYRHQKAGDKVFFIKDINRPDIDLVGQYVKIPGKHNLKNAVMAYQVAKYLGCPEEKILEEIFKFKGMEHRLELVVTTPVIASDSEAIFKDRHGAAAPRDDNGIKNIKFINDSASTNPQTTLAAIKAFPEPKIIIAGGKDKNLDYSAWVEEFPKHNIKAVVLFGENKEKLRVILTPDNDPREESKRSFELHSQDDLGGAVKLATKLAQNYGTRTKSHFVQVLFSPGAASFDMFADYADRGNKFKEIVLNHTGNANN